MSSGLDRLPFDVVHQIGSQLDIRSYNNLAKACRPLYQHLQDENTVKNALQASLPHNLWAQLVLSQQQSNVRHTLGRIDDCQAALQQASPYSACIIAHGSSFAYDSGILCYTACDSLRILNFNDRRNTEKVFEGSVLANHIAVTQQGTEMLDLESLRSMQVLGYAHDIMVLHCDFGPFGQYVFAVNISDSRPPNAPEDGHHRRVRLCTLVGPSSKLFVRHNDKYLVIGSHSATGSHGHHEWLLKVFNLETGEFVNAEPLQLADFYGSEIGSTVCFTIHDGYFYAVTNQTSFESEEVDWTSYYHVIKFQLEEPLPELAIKVIWRRQHLEGPINDAWNDLGFQLDYHTGELLIVECRKEWVNGGSRATRTYYTQSVHRAEFKDLKDGLRHPPTDDRLISTLDEHSNSRYEESKVRIDRYVHTEFPAVNEDNIKEYIRAKTKWNGYSFNTQSFVDLVTDEVVVGEEWRPRQRIRLRVVSRQELCPMVRDEASANTTALRIRHRIKDREGEELEDGERAFSPSNVYLWPPDDAPQELYEILCPEGRTGDVKAILGDEGIIYMAGPPRVLGSPERALVFICFDPTFGFAGMKRLDGSSAVQKRDKKRKPEAELEVETEKTDEPQLSSSCLMEGTKKLKIEQRYETSISINRSSSIPVQEKPEPDMSVLPHGDAVAEALGLDPPSPVAALFSTQGPDLWPPPLLLDTAAPPGPSTSSALLPSSDSDPHTPHGSGKGKGKGKARAQPPPHTSTSTLSTWREKAAYIATPQGYWLR